MSRFLIALGLLLILLGVCWPWLTKLPFGRLPGDIVVERQNFRFYFPITTSIVLSIVLTILAWFLRK